MTSVQEYAAREARYICEKRNPGVGYSQTNRWSWYDRCDDQGWLNQTAEGDCSSLVTGAYNIAKHVLLGTPYVRDGSQGMFPVSGATWTGTIPGLALERGFIDRGDAWTGVTPDGGFCRGDLLMADGHVAMAVLNADGSFNPWNPDIADMWIDSTGDIYGSAGADGSEDDDTGSESSIRAYLDHPFTRRAKWTTCLSYDGPGSSGKQSSEVEKPKPQAPSKPDWRGSMVGMDISMHQDGINVGASGAEAVFVKATEGSGYVDPCFRQHADAVLASGKLLGLYHFSWNSANSVSEEVDTFLGAVGPYLGKAVLCLDFEDPNGVWNVAWAEEWLDTVKARTGYTPIIYMYANAATTYGWESVASRYWLWIAGYPGDSPSNLINVSCPYDPGHGWWLFGWQYTDEGRVSGYGGNVDLNSFYVNANYWNWLAGGQGEDDELMASEAVTLLQQIHNDLTYGEAGVKQAGHVIYAIEKVAEKVDALSAKVQVISDAVTPGKEGVKFDGELYNQVKEARNSLARMEKQTAEAKAAQAAGIA